jgi:hypothetical protein
MPHRSFQPPAPQETANPETAHPRTAVRWVAVLVAGVGFAAVVADRDSRNRLQIEQAVERTAVGDRSYFPTEDGRPLVFEAAPLTRAAAPESKQETSMLVAGTLDGLLYRLYVPGERMEGDGSAGGSSWWLKTGPGLFLKVSR